MLIQVETFIVSTNDNILRTHPVSETVLRARIYNNVYVCFTEEKTNVCRACSYVLSCVVNGIAQLI